MGRALRNCKVFKPRRLPAHRPASGSQGRPDFGALAAILAPDRPALSEAERSDCLAIVDAPRRHPQGRLL